MEHPRSRVIVCILLWLAGSLACTATIPAARRLQEEAYSGVVGPRYPQRVPVPAMEVLYFQVRTSFDSQKFEQEANSVRRRISNARSMLNSDRDPRKACLIHRLADLNLARAIHSRLEFTDIPEGGEYWGNWHDRWLGWQRDPVCGPSGELKKNVKPVVLFSFAETIYLGVLRKDPDYGRRDEVLFAIAYIRSLLCAEEASADLYAFMLSRFPESHLAPDAHLALSGFHLDSNELDEARKEASEARRLGDPAVRVLADYYLAWLDYYAGNLKPALDTLGSAIDRLDYLQRSGGPRFDYLAPLEATARVDRAWMAQSAQVAR